MCVTPLAAAFRSSFAYSSGWHRKGSRRSLTKRYNWFKDVVSEAFANNESFDDAVDGQVDYGIERDNSMVEQQRRLARYESRSSTQQVAPIDEDKLVGTKWSMNMFLAGIPDTGNFIFISFLTKQKLLCFTFNFLEVHIHFKIVFSSKRIYCEDVT